MPTTPPRDPYRSDHAPPLVRDIVDPPPSVHAGTAARADLAPPRPLKAQGAAARPLPGASHAGIPRGDFAQAARSPPRKQEWASRQDLPAGKEDPDDRTWLPPPGSGRDRHPLRGPAGHYGVPRGRAGADPPRGGPPQRHRVPRAGRVPLRAHDRPGAVPRGRLGAARAAPHRAGAPPDGPGLVPPSPGDRAARAGAGGGGGLARESRASLPGRDLRLDRLARRLRRGPGGQHRRARGPRPVVPGPVRGGPTGLRSARVWIPGARWPKPAP